MYWDNWDWEEWEYYNSEALRHCNLLGRDDVVCTFDDFKEALELVEEALAAGEGAGPGDLWPRLAARHNERMWSRRPADMLDLAWPPRWDPDPVWPPEPPEPPQRDFEEMMEQFKDPSWVEGEWERMLARRPYKVRKCVLQLACALELAVLFRCEGRAGFRIVDPGRLEEHLEFVSWFIRPCWLGGVDRPATYLRESFGFDRDGFWQALAWRRKDIERWEGFLRSGRADPGHEPTDPVNGFCEVLGRLLRERCAGWERLAKDVWWKLKDPCGWEIVLDPSSYWNPRNTAHPYFMVEVSWYEAEGDEELCVERDFLDYADPAFLYRITEYLNLLGIDTDVPYWVVAG
jgi:hypothetical protein